MIVGCCICTTCSNQYWGTPLERVSLFSASAGILLYFLCEAGVEIISPFLRGQIALHYFILQSFCISADSNNSEQTPPLLAGLLNVWSQLQRLQVVVWKTSRQWSPSIWGGRQEVGVQGFGPFRQSFVEEVHLLENWGKGVLPAGVLPAGHSRVRERGESWSWGSLVKMKRKRGEVCASLIWNGFYWKTPTFLSAHWGVWKRRWRESPPVVLWVFKYDIQDVEF